MKNICVFCGSKEGKGEKYLGLAKELGTKLVESNYGLVYGGASIGVMGKLADAILEKNGHVKGVIPKSIMEWEVEHKGLSDLEIVSSMHERKEKMYRYSDSFLAIPGGMGTLDELCEIITWAQLQYHQKPIFVLNQFNFFENLIKHFEFIVDEGFLSREHLDFIRIVNSVDEFINEVSKNI